MRAGGVRPRLGAPAQAGEGRAPGGLGAHHGVPARGEPLAAYDARPAPGRPGRRRCRTETPRRDEAHVALVAALKQLPEAQRQALVLHHIADLPVHDVAREVGVPEGTIKARLSRGRAALAALLADEDQEGVSHA